MTNINDILEIELKSFNDENGSLVPIESKIDCLIEIKRIFYVFNVPEGDVRGKHSHKDTTQVMICTNGSCEVTCDDGYNEKTYILDKPDKALYVPPGIWAKQKYNSDTILMVLCDSAYSEEDYIFNYKDFKSTKNE